MTNIFSIKVNKRNESIPANYSSNNSYEKKYKDHLKYSTMESVKFDKKLNSNQVYEADWTTVSTGPKQRKNNMKKLFDDESKHKNKYSRPTYEITGLNIQKMPSCSTNFPSNKLMKSNIIPCFPFSLMVVGQTGSGKTNLIINMFSNTDMYNGYFDEIILFAATGLSDNLFTNLGIDKDHIVEKNMVRELKCLLKGLEEDSNSIGPEKMPRRCLVFEDLTSEKKLQNSEEFTACWTRNRHNAYAVIGAVHKYKGLHRTSRLNAGHKIIFPTDLSDVEAIVKDDCPANMSAKQFTKVIEYAFTTTNEITHPFLYINKKVPENIRYRKCFSEIINLDYFKQ